MLHGKEEMLPRVSSVETHSDYSMTITFKNGERRLFDASPLLSLPIYRNLGKVFSSARVEYGTVVWPQDMDISPDTLYLRGTKI